MSNYIDRKDIINDGEIKKGISEVATSLTELRKLINGIVTDAKKMQTSLGKSGSYKQTVQNITNHAKNTEKLTAAQNEQLRVSSQLERVNAKLQNASSKENQELIRKQEQLKRVNQQYRQQAKEQLGISKRTNGLATSFKKLAKSVAGYFLAIASVQRIVQFFTRDLLNMNKKLDSQEFAMRTVIKDNIEYKTTIAELSEIAKNYGQDLLVLRERYIKFRAAAIQSNVSAQDTMKIFNSTAKAAGVLGLKSDELNGVFLALEQMLSKGKVTTEELRRQLGERLPGAMGIMADAIGVTISELDKMMKKGEVLSSMALPKFAEQLERAYGIEYVTNIDTLAAAQGRLNTSWTEFISSLESSGIYIDILNSLGKSLTNIRDAFEGVSGKAKRFENEILNDIIKKTEEFNTNQEKRKYIESEINRLIKERNDLEKDALTRSGNESAREWDEELARYKALANVVEELTNKLNSMGEARKPLNKWEKEFNVLESGFEGSKDAYEMIEKIGLNAMNELTRESAEEYLEDGKNHKEWLRNKIAEITKYVDDSKEQYDREQTYLDENNPEKQIDAQKMIVELQKGKIEELEKLKETQKRKDRKRTEEQIKLLQEEMQERINIIRKLQNEYKESTKMASESYKIYKDFAELQTKMQLELYEEPKTRKSSDDRLQRARLENEIKIADFQRAQRERWQKFVEKTNADELLSELEKRDKIAQYEAQMNVQLLEYKRDLNDELSKINGLQSIEYRQIAKDDAEFMKQIQDEISQESAKNKQRDNEILIDEAQKLSKATIDQYYDMADAQYISAQETSLKRIEEQKLTNRQIEKLQRELAEHQVEMDILAVQGMLESGDLYGDDVARKQNELQELYKRLNEIRIQNSKKGNEDDLENLREWAQAVGEVFNTLMDILQDYYDRQLEQSKNLYEKQIGYAGASVEERLAAETMYQKRDAEIKKKKAIAEKIQTVFNIGLGMLEATAQLPSPMAIAQLIAGGAAMAAAVATPIPAYSKGGKHEGGVAKVSEKGEEIFIDKKGKAYLTPKKETIANFPAGEFIPHDKTQQMLAEYAMNQQAEMLDMTNTNNYLKNIERNTKNNAATEYVGGYKIVRRNGVTSKIRTR